MQPTKSESFSFKRNNSATGSSSSSCSSSSTQKCRRKLQDRFDETCPDVEKTDHNRSVLSVLNLNDTRRVFSNGAERLTRAFNSVRTSLGTFSQKFRISTKRRQILEEGPMTPGGVGTTPHTMSKQVLGRTPTKMYSPFGIESPYRPTTYEYEKENCLHPGKTYGR